MPTDATREQFRLSAAEQTLIEIMAYNTLPSRINQDIREYNNGLLTIIGAANSGVPDRTIDRIVAGLPVNSRLGIISRDFIGTMIQVTGIEETANGRTFKGVVIDDRANRVFDYNGRTYNKYIGDIRQNNQAQLRRFAGEAIQAVRNPQTTGRTLLQGELSRYRRRITSIFRTWGLALRQTGYGLRDRALGLNDIDYWISIAVLDGATSAICLRYHERRWKRGDVYKTRGDLPNNPPRHPNCRSLITTVYKGATDPEIPSVEDVFFRSKRGRAAANMLFGKRKAKLISDNLDKVTVRELLVGNNTDVKLITNNQLKRLINTRD